MPKSSKTSKAEGNGALDKYLQPQVSPRTVPERGRQGRKMATAAAAMEKQLEDLGCLQRRAGPDSEEDNVQEEAMVSPCDISPGTFPKQNTLNGCAGHGAPRGRKMAAIVRDTQPARTEERQNLDLVSDRGEEEPYKSQDVLRNNPGNGYSPLKSSKSSVSPAQRSPPSNRKPAEVCESAQEGHIGGSRPQAMEVGGKEDDPHGSQLNKPLILQSFPMGQVSDQIHTTKPETLGNFSNRTELFYSSQLQLQNDVERFAAIDSQIYRSSRAETHLLPTDLCLSIEMEHKESSLSHTCPAMAAFLQDFPTKADLAIFAADIKSSFRQDLQGILQDFRGLSERVSVQEAVQASFSERLVTLESAQKAQQKKESQILLYLDDLENRNRRNNVKIRGLPEVEGDVKLKSKVMSILNMFLDRDTAEVIELDRIHRVGPLFKSAQQQYPRDILCRIHLFRLKEEIMRNAWSKKSIDFDGAVITLLPDLTKRTLHMRRSLKPLLDLICRLGGSYSWGYPMYLLVKYKSDQFALYNPEQLPALFLFLESNPVEVPDWLDWDFLMLPRKVFSQKF